MLARCRWPGVTRGAVTTITTGADAAVSAVRPLGYGGAWRHRRHRYGSGAALRQRGCGACGAGGRVAVGVMKPAAGVGGAQRSPEQRSVRRLAGARQRAEAVERPSLGRGRGAGAGCGSAALPARRVPVCCERRWRRSSRRAASGGRGYVGMGPHLTPVGQYLVGLLVQVVL